MHHNGNRIVRERRSTIRTALKQTAAASGWSKTQIAAECGVTEKTIERFYDGTIATLKGEIVLTLMRALPGFAQRLGFEMSDSAVARAS